MPLPSACVGAVTPAVEHHVDERWTMAYAAGLGDADGCYLDTTRADGVVAHPLFPVCLEWPVVLDARDLVPRDQLPRDELVRGVHASHDLRIHRLVRPGDVLTTTATVEGVEQRRPGAYEVLRLDTVDQYGAPVCVTRMGSLFLGVEVTGGDRPARIRRPPRPRGSPPPGPPTRPGRRRRRPGVGGGGPTSLAPADRGDGR
jgi:acyl dehydratase